MTWLSLVATLLGASIALGTAVLIEQRRERREDRLERRKSKREIYGKYLAVHAEMRAVLRALSLAPAVSDDDRRSRAFSAYASCYAARYELEVFAPRSVLIAAKEFDRRAKDLRDLVMNGRNMLSGVGEPPRMESYLEAMRLVHLAMRADLGADAED